MVDGDLASPVSIAQPSVHAIACLCDFRNFLVTGEDGHASTCHELGHFARFTPFDLKTKHDFNSRNFRWENAQWSLQTAKGYGSLMRLMVTITSILRLSRSSATWVP